MKSAILIFALAAALAATYITAARMIDPASGKVVTDPAITIENGKILSVGTKSRSRRPQAQASSGAMTILPGLIDMHTHLIGDTGGRWIPASAKREKPP
ncbi:MAG: hypothetical protein R3C42_02535 [Parvularculaceae bacterium]